MVKIYGIKNCDSVRKAIRFLTKHEIFYTFIDFRESPVGDNEIAEWLGKTTVETLFNTRSTTYRTLKLKEKNLTNKERCRWLARENMLIKRPVLLFENHLIIGYNESQYQEVLLKETH